MCGILAILKLDPGHTNYAELRNQALAMVKKIRHRGPDWSGIYSDEQAISCARAALHRGRGARRPAS